MSAVSARIKPSGPARDSSFAGFQTPAGRTGPPATSPSEFLSEIDTANVESVEVLKGPAAILYGRIEPGGMVNVVTKRPLETTSGALEQQVGSYDFYRTLWDMTGTVTHDKSLSVRFAGGYQHSGSFRDFNFTDRKVFSPSVSWRLTDCPPWMWK